jgi:hypothetical protein
VEQKKEVVWEWRWQKEDESAGAKASNKRKRTQSVPRRVADVSWQAACGAPEASLATLHPSVDYRRLFARLIWG